MSELSEWRLTRDRPAVQPICQKLFEHFKERISDSTTGWSDQEITKQAKRLARDQIVRNNQEVTQRMFEAMISFQTKKKAPPKTKAAPKDSDSKSSTSTSDSEDKKLPSKKKTNLKKKSKEEDSGSSSSPNIFNMRAYAGNVATPGSQKNSPSHSSDFSDI